MPVWELAGQWCGQYEYDPCEDMPRVPAPVEFTFVAHQGWFGRFNGVVQDDPIHGVPEEARVWGKVNRNRLTFMKRYPIEYMRFESRSVALWEYLEMEFGHQCDEVIAPMPIHADPL